MKYDDARWHEEDAGDDTFAATHIALFYVWLVNHGFVLQSEIDSWDVPVPFPNAKPPTYYFEFYSDNKLLSNYLTEEGVRFCEDRYQGYLEDVSYHEKIPFARDESREIPYNILDTWENVGLLDEYFHLQG